MRGVLFDSVDAVDDAGDTVEGREGSYRVDKEEAFASLK